MPPNPGGWVRKPCSICIHPNRDSIDKLLYQEISVRDLEAQFSLSKSALGRHKQKCLQRAGKKARHTQLAVILPLSPQEEIRTAQEALRRTSAFTARKNGSQDGNGMQPGDTESNTAGPQNTAPRKTGTGSLDANTAPEKASTALDNSRTGPAQVGHLERIESSRLARAACAIRTAADAIACLQLATVEAGINYHAAGNDRMKALWHKAFTDGVSSMAKLSGWEPKAPSNDNRSVTNIFANLTPDKIDDLLALAAPPKDSA